jgi:predicted dehydrogenase
LRAKIIGAGSIGNHLARALRSHDVAVDLVDTDGAALARARDEIYPARYGTWDAVASGSISRTTRRSGGYDLIVIGTPPDVHLPLATGRWTRGAAHSWSRSRSPPRTSKGLDAFVGPGRLLVDPRVRRLHARRRGRDPPFVERLRDGEVGEVLTVDTETREHWGGILAAHPWLPGPEASYLGSWRRGGGALGEHSHGLHLWQQLARAVGAGEVSRVSATLQMASSGGVEYDRIAMLDLTTDQRTRRAAASRTSSRARRPRVPVSPARTGSWSSASSGSCSAT